MKKTVLGFTLAEVLVTLLIIGVVSSIVIPVVLQDIQEAELRTAWKKSYADIKQASMRLISDNGGTLKGINFSTNTLKNGFLSYLSYTMNCNTGTTVDNCWVNKDMFSPTGGIVWSAATLRSTIGSAILNNGSTVFFHDVDTNCNSNTWSGQLRVCAVIGVDINGLKKPNIVGKDLFFMWLTENNLYPRGTQGDTRYCGNGDWTGCSAAYLYQ